MYFGLVMGTGSWEPVTPVIPCTGSSESFHFRGTGSQEPVLEQHQNRYYNYFFGNVGSFIN